jgi:hypothetical protein
MTVHFKIRINKQVRVVRRAWREDGQQACMEGVW